MPARIEDCALLGDCETAALVSRDGSIDWLCWPRFDSPACFAALLGNEEHGRWKIAPEGEVRQARRRYREGTLILETELETAEGVVALMLPIVGFLPATDPRIVGTVRLIEDRLVHDGFVRRYSTRGGVDGLPGDEGAFLLCTFWLADNLAPRGRRDEAVELFERLLAIRNDVGLLAEEYDPIARRLVGNFPQAFSHVGLINTARNLAQVGGPAEDRPERVRRDRASLAVAGRR